MCLCVTAPLAEIWGFYACVCNSEARKGQTVKWNSVDFSTIRDSCTVDGESCGRIISLHLAKTAEGMLWRRDKSWLTLSERILLYKLGWLTGKS